MWVPHQQDCTSILHSWSRVLVSCILLVHHIFVLLELYYGPNLVLSFVEIISLYVYMGPWGSFMSWCFGIGYSLTSLTNSLLVSGILGASFSFSWSSSAWNFLDLIIVASSSNVASLLILIWYKTIIYIL